MGDSGDSSDEIYVPGESDDESEMSDSVQSVSDSELFDDIEPVTEEGWRLLSDVFDDTQPDPSLHGTGGGSLKGPELTKLVKEQLDDLAKQNREERREQWSYEAEQRNYAEEQRQLEDTREEQRRQHEFALKESEQALKESELAFREKELELEKARRESAEAMAIQQASNPTPAAPNAQISSINSPVPLWTEEEPEA
ncbi:ensconsin-like [Macrobrachium rosenbergii]|uniref:ensconsin-like n=1 Tax=Macrobrachium rosenbergii TaxID=79674 RepID=UPI0034D6302F